MEKSGDRYRAAHKGQSPESELDLTPEPFQMTRTASLLE